MVIRSMAACAGLSVAIPAAAQQQRLLLIPDWTSDQIMAFRQQDGSLVRADYITNATGATMASPKEAMQVGNEIWVSDQIADQIFRFSLDGTTLLGAFGPAAGMDNMRGFEVANGKIFVACGTPQQITVVDVATGAVESHWPENDPFDVLLRNGELLVASVTADELRRYGFDGTPLGVFHNSDGISGIDWPQQMHIRGGNGNVMCAGFSAPIGLYEYDENGVQVGVIEKGGGNRGVYALGDGNIMWTDGNGVHIHDAATGGTLTALPGVNAQYINLLIVGNEPTACYGNCDASTSAPVLNVADFTCFLQRFAAGEAYANCDQSTLAPALNVADFTCFLQKFAAGCSAP